MGVMIAGPSRDEVEMLRIILHESVFQIRCLLNMRIVLLSHSENVGKVDQGTQLFGGI